MLKSAPIVACLLGVVLSAQETFSPARYRAGTVPALPIMALGGGQVFVELAVSSRKIPPRCDDRRSRRVAHAARRRPNGVEVETWRLHRHPDLA